MPSFKSLCIFLHIRIHGNDSNQLTACRLLEAIFHTVPPLSEEVSSGHKVTPASSHKRRYHTIYFLKIGAIMNNKEFILHGIQSVVDHTLPQHHVFGDLFTTAQQRIQKLRGLKLWKSEPI